MASLSVRSIAEEANDLSALHQIRQDEMVVDLFASLHQDSFSPRRCNESNLGMIHESTISWFQQASIEEKQDKGILFPGIFESNRFYAADLLRQEKNGSWTLYVVKAGSKVKERYLQEVDWIKRGFSQRGIAIHLVRLLLPSKNFKLTPDANFDTYFEEISLTHEVKHLRRSSAVLLSSLESKLLNSPSFLELDDKPWSVIQAARCNFPSNCPICSQVSTNQVNLELNTNKASFNQITHLDYSVFQLFRSGSLAKKLQSEGIHDIRNISRAPTYLKRELKPRHFIQAEAFRSGVPQIQEDKLGSWFKQLTFPLEFLDFESFSSAMPPFLGTQPWQPIPFAVSITQAKDWDTPWTNKVWVATPGTDGRQELIQLLVEGLGSHSGSILVYGKEFEVSILRLLQDQSKDEGIKQNLDRCVSRIVDVQDIFSQFWYYDPAQGAKISLKNLVPLLTTGTHYKDLEIQDGAAASFGYFFHSFPDPWGRDQGLGLTSWQVFQEELKNYAALDTLGLTEIIFTLHTKVV